MVKFQIFLTTLLLAPAAFAAKPSASDVHATSDGSHEATSGLPQLDLTWFPSQIFWLGIAFTILYIAFATRIVPAISANLENRDQIINNDLETAENLTKQASDFQKSYEQSLLNARLESTQMMTDLDDKMRKDHEKKQAAFLKKTEEKILDTKSRLEEMTLSSMKEVEKHIEEAALLAAKNVAGIDTDGKAVKAALKAVNSNIKAEAA